MPGTWMSSLTCWKPISASPRATTAATGSPDGGPRTLRLLPAISPATPSFGNSVPERYVPLPLSEYAIDFAARSVARKASTLPMSGFAAPARTTIPTCESASSTLLSPRTTPRLPSSSAAAPSRITTSALSPRARRAGIASGESPIEGPRVVTRWWPLARSKAGASSE